MSKLFPGFSLEGNKMASPKFGDYRIVEYEDGKFYPQVYKNNSWRQVPDVSLYYLSLSEAKDNVNWYKRKTTILKIHNI